MKKIITCCLTVALILVMVTPAMALEKTKSINDSIQFSLEPTNNISTFVQDKKEEFVVSYITDVGQNIIITKIVDADGLITLHSYTDEILKEIVEYTLGSTSYVYKTIKDNQVISTEHKEAAKGFEKSVSVSPMAARPLGYMHYNNPFTGRILSIYCTIDDDHTYREWNITSWRGTLAQLIVQYGSALLMPPELAAAAILASTWLWDFAGDVVENLLATWVEADVYNHVIRGVSTTDPNTTDIGYLYGATAYVADGTGAYDIYREGYTPNLWGTGELGRMMFWEVYGIEYTPTSWSGIDG